MSNLERFNKNARVALTVAQRESLALNHSYIGTEHLLLGLITSGGVAGSILLRHGITETSARSHVHAQTGRGERKRFDPPTVVPRLKKVLGMAVGISKQFSDEQVSTGHILLALLDEGESAAIGILQSCLSDDNLQRHKRLGQNTLTAVRNGLVTKLKGKGSFVSSKEDSLAMQSVLDSVVTRTRSTDLDNLANLASYEYRLKWAKERAAQEERSRIARDLHDSIKQQLFNIKMSAAAVQERLEIDADGAKSALSDVQESAQAAMVEMSALLMQLSPEPLEKIGLVEALREQCQALAFRTGAQVNTAFSEQPPDELLPLGTHLALFRIGQEALANVARHARADQVRVRLDTIWDEYTVLLEVSDDGQGFEPHKVLTGMGLANMRERVELLKGSIEIESQLNEGSRVTVKIPFLKDNTDKN